MRRFALDRVQSVSAQETPAHEISPEEISRAFDRTYGIFGGVPAETAVLRFSDPVAQWVSEEIWHPRQKSFWLDDGRYELWIEIGHNPAELLQDILRYGASVEVIEPASFREEAIRRFKTALAIYDKQACSQDE